METLYDLLGALPRDDADELRSAFRRAVKGAHPDINPGDPDAGIKFRQIIRANDILSDQEQRAAYDHLLVLAEGEQKSLARQSVVRVVHRIASAVFTVAVISIISIGSFALVLHLSAKSVAPSSKLQIAARAPAEPSVVTPPVTPAPPPPVVAAEAEPVAQDQQPVKVQEAPPARTEAASVMSEPIAPVTEPISQSAVPILPAGMVPAAAVTLASATESAPPAAPPVVGAPLDLSLNDPRSLRAHGIVAYRNGDLNGALADFNQAIQRDPTFAEAYIDRGIVLYRMRKFERAFADLAQAKKLDHANKTHSGPTPSAMVPPGGVPATTPKRPRLFGQAGLAFGMMRRPTGVE